MKHAAILVTCAALLAAPSLRAMPVYDAANHATVKLNQASNYAQFVQQVTQLKLQLDEAKRMYNAMNGVRGMGSLINNPAARHYLPKSASGLYNLSQGAGRTQGLSGSLEAIRRAAQIMTPAQAATPQTARMLDRQQTQIATMQATAEASYNAAGARFDTLQTLVNRVDLAQDPKAAADLANRINAENAMLQNEMIKLNMLAMIQSAQEKQLKQQARETMAKVGPGKPVYVSGY
ncbi:P-type DNA transfer protein VirB5 [Massilia soli]|uniref:P-type DNA transfer protein VirB5 n=1 Tax=Massilia soli TaxID=2792854 RepID=A0ABS7SLZ5_9BURK|nr:P-type DNA transfer protein VirB5 [Massilia soli]MBZ2207149.1 P-type DNA transfer protein VirB5 [Massilia soli]